MTRFSTRRDAPLSPRPLLALATLTVLCWAPPAAQAQAGAGALELTPRIGVVRHELLDHTAAHPTLGLQATALRRGALRLSVSADGWLDGIDLGEDFGGRVVDARYVLYGAAVEVAGERLFASAGVGGETVFFGERHEAAALLPESSTSPQGSLGVGARVPLDGDRSRWSARLEGRGHAVYAEVFDPTGVEEGRELAFLPMVTLGISHSVR